LALFCV